MSGTPERATRQTERIDDVAHQHDALSFHGLQKLIEFNSTRMPEAKMDVREKQGTAFDPRAAAVFAVRSHRRIGVHLAAPSFGRLRIADAHVGTVTTRRNLSCELVSWG